MITPLRASNIVGEPKTETYRLLNMIHQMAGMAANHCAKKSWWLYSTASYSDYMMTTWSNGIVQIKAETYKQDGVAVRHDYSMVVVDDAA